MALFLHMSNIIIRAYGNSPRDLYEQLSERNYAAYSSKKQNGDNGTKFIGADPQLKDNSISEHGTKKEMRNF